MDIKIKKSAYSKTDRPTWKFTDSWNLSLDKVDSFDMYERDYMWASELGKSQIDIWHRLKGEDPSNPFDKRAKRKFDAGVMWEWILELIAKRSGIFLGKQGKVKYQMDDLMEVSGKYDLLVGGDKNTKMIKKMEEALEVIQLPDRFVDAMDYIEESIDFRNPLPKRMLEIKSSSSFMYDAKYKYGDPAENHALQCLHYLLATGIEEGAVVYISKDDARITEIPIWRDDPKLNQKYREIVEAATHYQESGKEPPKEPDIIFDFGRGKFTDNWNIKYSGYLTAIYGFEHESDYKDKYKSRIASWNRVLTRIKKGKRMTDSNLNYIEEMKAYLGDSIDFDEIVENIRDDDVEIHDDGYYIEDDNV